MSLPPPDPERLDDPVDAPPADRLTRARPVSEEIPSASAEGSRSLRSSLEWVAIIVGALLVALIIKALLVQAFYIPSESMTPTLKVRDRVLVNKLSYHLHAVHRGDIVVFKRPPLETDTHINDLIKRIVGLPGERIEGRDGHVLINGHQLNEPYLPSTARTDDFNAQTVPAGEYFVMGDNRQNSKDSRFFGPIKRNLLVGRAFIRVWPISHIHFL